MAWLFLRAARCEARRGGASFARPGERAIKSGPPRMDLRLLAAAGALAGCWAAGAAEARDMTVAMHENGGGMVVRDALDQIAFKPFGAAVADPVTVVAWSGGLAVV